MKEIKKSWALRLYGAALALTHVLTIYQWYFDRRFAFNILERYHPSCWPFFESCFKWRPFSGELLHIYFVLYLLISFGSFFLFLDKKRPPQNATYLLGTALVLKLLVSISDYRFMGNFHYMCYFVHFAYLFFPNRKQLIPLLLISFYVGASLVKFNTQWITGEALLKPTIISGTLLIAACIYVVILELILSPFVIYGSRKFAYFVFSQLIIFHLFSWHIVGYLYPLMMLLLISIFPLLWIKNEFSRSDFHFSKIKRNKSTLAFLGFFWIAQTGPLWFMGDSAQSGEGRIFSLNMLDAKVKCEEFTFLKYKNKTVEVSEFNFDEGYRIGCDPLLRLSLAKHHCRERSKDPEFKNLDFEFFSQKKEGAPFKKIISILDFCKSQPTYSMFEKNTWIQDEEITSSNIVSKVRPNNKDEIPSNTSLKFAGTEAGWIYAFNKNKEVIWSFYADESFMGVSATPQEDEKFLYFLSGNGRLYSLYKNSGELHWVTFLEQKISFNFSLDEKSILLKTKDSKITVSKETGEITSIVQ